MVISKKQKTEIEKIIQELSQREHVLDIRENALNRKEQRLIDKTKEYHVNERTIVSLQQQLEESASDEMELAKASKTTLKLIVKYLKAKQYNNALKIALKGYEAIEDAGY